jgi:sensor domain CHASE-containing protein
MRIFGVRFRTLLAFFVVLIVFPVVIYSLSKMPGQKISDLYEQRTGETTNYIQNIVLLNSQKAKTLAFDYTYWDEMVTFVNNPDATWAQDNLDPALSSYGVDAIWVYNPSLKLSYAIDVNNANIKHNIGIDLPADTLSKISKGADLVHFYMKTGSDVIEVYGAAIHPSSDVERKTPAQGYFFCGKYLDGDYLSTIATMTSGEVSLSDQRVTQDSNDSTQLVLYIPLPDWVGNSVSNLKITTKFATLQSYNDEVRKKLYTNVMQGVIIMILSSWLAFLYSEGRVSRRRKEEKPTEPTETI